MQPRRSTPIVPPLSVRTADAPIELSASRVLTRAREALSLETIPLPVPIDVWIEAPLGYDFAIVGDGVLPQDALGMARPTQRQIMVHESLLEQEGRFRFTCAHELAHCVLHTDLAGELSDLELPSGDNTSRIEREADRFAAAVLMPLDTISRQIARGLAECGLDERSIEILRGDDVRAVWLWRRCLLPMLATKYGVSRSAFAYRMRELRLPGGRRLVRPSLVSLLIAPERVLESLPLDRIRVDSGVPVIDP